jgi:tetratricopeptide (TPR) repeat protein
MENEYLKLNKFYQNRELNKAINLGKTLLNKNLPPDKMGNVLEILGRSLDQLAISEKNKLKKREIQKKALKYFKQLKKTDNFKAYRGIGTIYHHQNNFKEAIKLYKKALEINPENTMIYNDLGNAYQRAWMLEKDQNNFDKAINFYNQALEKSKNKELKISPLINIALINNKAGKKDKAKKYAEESLKIINEINEPSYELFKKQLQGIVDKTY